MTDRKAEVKKIRDEFYRNKKRCITCEHLSEEGLCSIYKTEVPLEYIAEENQCEEYVIDIPF